MLRTPCQWAGGLSRDRNGQINRGNAPAEESSGLGAGSPKMNKTALQVTWWPDRQTPRGRGGTTVMLTSAGPKTGISMFVGQTGVCGVFQRKKPVPGHEGW